MAVRDVFCTASANEHPPKADMDVQTHAIALKIRSVHAIPAAQSVRPSDATIPQLVFYILPVWELSGNHNQDDSPKESKV
eukprot:2519303-Prymnesium_polylepis.1